MDLFRTSVTWISLLACVIFFSGCSLNSPVRHLSSEIGLVCPNKTTQEEIVSYMGFPDIKKSLSENEEEWIYYQENKSLLRRTPYLGDKIGQADFDVAIITIKNQVVISSQYRSFTEEEFNNLGITTDVEQ